MRERLLCPFAFLLLLLALIVVPTDVVAIEGAIYIRADGSVEGTAAIRRDGNVYTFTDNVYGSIVVEKDNVVVDGAGYTLQGTGNETGIQITSGENVTIKNLNIKSFGKGIALEDSSKCTIVGNNMVYNNWGIKLYNASGNIISENQITENIPIEGLFGGGIFIRGFSNRVYGNYIADNENGVILYNDYGCTSSNTISENYITNNDVGIRFYDGYGGTSNNDIFENYIANNGVGMYIDKIPWGGGVSNNSICRNSFVGNTRQVYDIYWDDKLFIPRSVNSWDNGTTGNYWSDYTGKDADGDGIGDTPYIIDENNRDNYPLMRNLIPPLETTPPTISVISPESKAYATSNISLTVVLSEPALWIGYSLNGQDNVTVAGNTTLTGLLDGNYSLTVYAKDAFENAAASETIHFIVDTIPPTVTLLSPQNQTYTSTNIPLTFTINERASWIGYSLDGQDNVTITEDTVLTGLPNGEHNLTVYAADLAGNTGASEAVYFNVEVPEPFPAALVIASTVTVAVVGVSILFYFKKIKEKPNRSRKLRPLSSVIFMNFAFLQNK
ncbi:MAG: right-handed parallel beta-helix repeat-containing protein [Candidatus Bathyarchaeales archaeon]